MNYPLLFSPLEVGPVVLPNRIVSSGHDTVMVENGEITDRLIAYHEARAAGGAGLLVLQVAAVHASARYTGHVLMADDDRYIEGYRRLCRALREYPTVLFGQLFHPGREVMESLDGSAPVAVSASSVPTERFGVMPRSLATWEVYELVEAYAKAGERLVRGGLSGVEVVASHGYLPAQFLSGATNLRSDEFGVDRELFLRLVLSRVRELVGAGVAVGLRVSVDEFCPTGLTREELLGVVARLGAGGLLDYVSVTAGSSSTLGGSGHIVPSMEWGTGYCSDGSRAVKSSVQVPVMVAGRINQPQEAERLLESRACDAVVMTRALICDPQLPAKARGGAGEEIRACVGCNQACIGHFQSGHPISCIQYPESGRELLYPRSRARRPKSVVVIGGGPGGLKVASVAALRGHSVHLFERDRQLGGAVRIAALIAGREEFGGVAQNLEGEARRAGVTITVGTHVRGGDVACLGADEVVVATGAQAYRGDLHILGEPHILGANEVLTGSGFSPGHVVVYDSRGDWVGVGCAVALRERGHRVSLAYSGVSVGERLQQYVRDEHILRVLRLGIETVPLVRLFGADSTSVYFQHVLSEEMVEIGGVCGLVTATGYRPATTLCDELDAAGIIYHTIGDALSPRSVEEAVLEGLKVGSAL